MSPTDPDVNVIDRHVKLFLSCCHRFCQVYYNDDHTPFWAATSNFPSLLNLAAQIKKLDRYDGIGRVLVSVTSKQWSGCERHWQTHKAVPVVLSPVLSGILQWWSHSFLGSHMDIWPILSQHDIERNDKHHQVHPFSYETDACFASGDDSIANVPKRSGCECHW